MRKTAKVRKIALASAIDMIAFNYIERGGRLTAAENKKLTRITAVMPKLKRDFNAYIKIAGIGGQIREPKIPADVSARLHSKLAALS